MKKIVIVFLLFIVNNANAQNPCEFDNIYQETVRDEIGCKSIMVNNNLYLTSVKGISDGYIYNNLFLRLTCLSNCGEIIWKKQVDSSLGPIEKNVYNLKFIDIISRKNNTILLVSNYTKVKTSIGAGLKLFNIDLAGNLIWKKTFGDTLSNYNLNSVTEINSNSYLIAGQKNGKAYFLICDTLAQIKKESTFSIDALKTSLIQKVQIMPNNTIMLLGMEDTIAFIKTIDTTGSLINTINLPTLKSNKVNYITFNHNNSKIIALGLPSYIAQYSLTGNLLKDTVLPDALWNQIQISKSYISSAAHYSLAPNLNFLNTTKYWIKFDSNYNFISKDSFSFQTYGSFSNIFILNNSIYGTGTLNASGGLGHTYYSAALKKINIFNYVTSITITGQSTIISKNGSILLTANILPTNTNNKTILWSINDTNLATITQTGLVTAKANGTVIVTATAADGGGVKATKTIIISNQTVGLNEVNLYNQITVYPNPVSNLLTIKTINNLTIQQLQLLDITGKMIAQFNNQTEIDLSEIANGMYLLQIQTENGNLIKQVVVNR
ncbi:MAG: Ig-like domain-containing protein [Bacteroidota bacterium]